MLGQCALALAMWCMIGCAEAQDGQASCSFSEEEALDWFDDCLAPLAVTCPRRKQYLLNQVLQPGSECLQVAIDVFDGLNANCTATLIGYFTPLCLTIDDIDCALLADSFVNALCDGDAACADDLLTFGESIVLDSSRNLARRGCDDDYEEPCDGRQHSSLKALLALPALLALHLLDF